MRYYKPILTLLVSLVLVTSVQAQEKSNKEKHAEKIQKMEETFWAASRAGTTVKGVFVEGNSLFNGTTAPQDRPPGEPYTPEEEHAAKQSAERNSKIFLLAEDGTLYYPCPPKGERITQSEQAHRIPRVLTEEQKQQGLFTWATPPPLVGRRVEVYGDIYPGYGGVKGLHIEYIYFEGEYIVGKKD